MSATTRALRECIAILLLMGLGAIFSEMLGLELLSWMVRNGLIASVIMMPILFFPELRGMLERIGRSRPK